MQKNPQKGQFLHEIRITNFLTIKPFLHKKNFKNIHELFQNALYFYFKKY